MRRLELILKIRWYEMIASGEKKEEYREIKPYWIKRLCFTLKDNPYIHCKTENCCSECFSEAGEEWTAFPFEVVRFRRGYSKTTMDFEIREISIGKGNPEWGAVAYEDYFIIKLGKRIN